MSTTPTSPPTTRPTPTRRRTTLTAAGPVCAVASAGYSTGRVLLSGLSSEQFHTALATATECLIADLADTAVAVMRPALCTVTRLPRWALSITSAGYAFIIQAWVCGTLILELANRLPAEEYDQIRQRQHLLVRLFEASTGLACVVSFIALAIAGWRRRAMSRACILFILAGSASLLGALPPAGFAVGLARAWTARSAASTTKEH